MATHPGQASQKQYQRRSRIALAFLGGVIALIFGIGLAAGDGGGPDEYGARDVCRQAVENRLVSPSSADFSTPEVNELAGSGTAYRIAGSVDADNRMGASVRITYECKARHVDGTEWEIIDLQHSER